MSYLIFAFGGLAAGLLAGLFGVGGGTLVVPVLLMLQIPIHQAVGLSLVYIVFSSASGALFHRKADGLDVKAVVFIALGALLSSYLGAKLGPQIAPALLAWLFALLMTLVILLFIWRSGHKLEESDPGDMRFIPLRYILIGGLAGFLSSLFGVGGGFVMVPLLVVFSPLSLSQSTGTSLGSIFFIALSGSVQHILQAELWPVLMTHGVSIFLMSVMGILGSPLGAYLHHKLPTKQLRLSFILFSLAVTLYLVSYGIKVS